MQQSRFTDRRTAGQLLGAALVQAGTAADVVVGLPRGGVPVAGEVALVLGVPLDVIVVRKLGVPGQRELAMGAIGEDGTRVVDADLVRRLAVSPDDLLETETTARAELERRLTDIRSRHPRIDLRGRSVLVVDDGIATGSTARAACAVARAHGAARVTLAVPVAPRGWERAMGDAADEYLALVTPDDLRAVGLQYDDFAPTTDDDVHRCLDAPTGQLLVDDGARGLVVFAHGSGSSSASPRNRHVAAVLRRHRLGTLVFDLLTPQEADDRRNVFDIGLLARRLVDTVAWARSRPELTELPVSLFGASTGAAAALWAAAEPGAVIASIVSRGGRPDLAVERLGLVEAPTLFIVGSRDTEVLELNRSAAARLTCTHEVAVVPGASHLFDEPGTLDRAAELAAAWFERHGTRG
jgi:predicted phosphoribosyltransferase/predicted alpha/beta-hydrolase family hydrolase